MTEYQYMKLQALRSRNCEHYILTKFGNEYCEKMLMQDCNKTIPECFDCPERFTGNCDKVFCDCLK